MDCDLQDCPDEIPNLYRKEQKGWDIVYTRCAERQDFFCHTTIFQATPFELHLFD
jgi:hypothetical protein